MTKAGLPLLFGSSTRSSFLVFVALNEGLSISEIARRTKINKSHVIQLTRRFSEMSLLQLGSGDHRSTTVSLRRDSSFARAMSDLLLVLGGHRVGRRSARGAGTTPKPATIRSLFGSVDRTKVLALLSVVGSASIVDLSRLTGIAHNSLRAVLAHFEREGVIRCERVPPHVFACLDDRFFAAPQLLYLCREVAKVLPHTTDVSRYQAQRLKAAAPVLRRSVPPHELVPFGRPTQVKLLLALAQVGAIRTADLSIVTGMTQDSVRGVSESLIRAGIVVCRAEKGGRNTERWYSLNTAYPKYQALRRFLIAVASQSPRLKRAELALGRGRSQMLPARRQRFGTLAGLGSNSRFDVLSAVAEKPRRTAEEIADEVKLPLWRARTHLWHLAEIGVIRYRPVDGRLRTEVGRRFRFAIELGELL
jgi:hypothetical protein